MFVYRTFGFNHLYNTVIKYTLVVNYNAVCIFLNFLFFNDIFAHITIRHY